MSKDPGKPCRRCLMRELSEADYERYILSSLRKIAPRDRAPEELYASRLQACRECGQLDNATCMSCGCLVELRAAMAKSRCPIGTW